jgi:hypothetical protein
MKKKPGFTIGINKLSLKTAELKAKRLNEELGTDKISPETKAEYDKEEKKIEIKFDNKIDPGN